MCIYIYPDTLIHHIIYHHRSYVISYTCLNIYTYKYKFVCSLIILNLHMMLLLYIGKFTQRRLVFVRAFSATIVLHNFCKKIVWKGNSRSGCLERESSINNNQFLCVITWVVGPHSPVHSLTEKN